MGAFGQHCRVNALRGALVASVVAWNVDGATTHLPQCRCLPEAPCWAEVPWAALNATVGGRLSASVDGFAACQHSGLESDACTEALAHYDDEFWLADQMNGYQHTGLYGTWNISNQLSAFSVRAESEADIQATVAFAAEHNLRLVVKNTGHDWFGRSAGAGSLLLWTHNLKSVHFHDEFTPVGSTDPGVPAVTVGAGVQFADVYPAANDRPYPGDSYGRRSLVVGGTCDSVGVAGCWLGGCYGPWAKEFGNGAVNLLEARVVLANGTLVTASTSSYPDLFYTLRGGGGGNTGVVTQFTARLHPAPRWVGFASFAATAATASEFQPLVKVVLAALAETMVGGHDAAGGMSCSGGGLGFAGNADTGYSLNFTCRGYESNGTAASPLFRTLLGYTNSQPGVSGNASFWTWSQTQYNASTPSFPWLEAHPDREISTELVGSLTKWFPIRGLLKESGLNSAETIANGVVSLTNLIATMECQFTNYIMFAKQQSGMDPMIEARFNETAQNPVVLNTIGLWAPYGNIPSLPQLRPSAKLLKALWPRLQEYAVLSKADPLWAPCAAGAAGDNAAAVTCLQGWSETRIPQLLPLVDKVRNMAWDIFPNVGADGRPFSGSYWNEDDYWNPDFAGSHWGPEVYPKLLRLKDLYDPTGLFYGHHAVGSERWTADGNCRLNRTK